MKTILFLSIFLCSNFSRAQDIDIIEVDSLPGMTWSDTMRISQDTLYSLTSIYLNDMIDRSYTLKFKFKYLGESGKIIVRAFTGDPHYISRYPKEPLIKDSIYEFNVSFYNRGRLGPMYKRMGFNFSDGTKAFFNFRGNVVKVSEED